MPEPKNDIAKLGVARYKPGMSLYVEDLLQTMSHLSTQKKFLHKFLNSFHPRMWCSFAPTIVCESQIFKKQKQIDSAKQKSGCLGVIVMCWSFSHQHFQPLDPTLCTLLPMC